VQAELVSDMPMNSAPWNDTLEWLYPSSSPVVVYVRPLMFWKKMR
jgi:hypothetical protein